MTAAKVDLRSACTVLAMELQALERRLMDAGFWETARKVNDAVKAIGYEAAGQRVKQDHLTAAERRCLEWMAKGHRGEAFLPSSGFKSRQKMLERMQERGLCLWRGCSMWGITEYGRKLL